MRSTAQSVWLDSQPLEEMKCKSLCTEWKPEQIYPDLKENPIWAWCFVVILFHPTSFHGSYSNDYFSQMENHLPSQWDMIHVFNYSFNNYYWKPGCSGVINRVMSLTNQVPTLMELTFFKSLYCPTITAKIKDVCSIIHVVVCATKKNKFGK